MSGDKINVLGKSYYFTNTAGTSGNSNIPILNIITGFLGGATGAAATSVHGAITPAQINPGTTNTNVNDFFNQQTTQSNATPTKPKAFINVLFFDEQFNAVDYKVSMVGNASTLKDHFADLQNLVATKSGFVYIYCNNESPVNVYFDNLQVVHTRSPLLETNEYYPYGLKMANISYKASTTMVNRYGFNGGNEYEDEGELNYSNTFYRKYDAQIGRFTGVNMLAEEFYNFSPYNFGLGNPVMFNDPSGALNSTPINPASFSKARNLLDYIQKNGIDNFEDQFNSWTFGGGGNVTEYKSGNNFSYNADRSEITINWSGTIYTQTKTEWGNGVNYQTLNTLVLGQTKIKVQTLWNKALSWGEKHRTTKGSDIWGREQNFDVMWQHNYKGFKDRLGRRKALSQKGDRASYAESLGAMQAQHDREESARQAEQIMLGVFAAPFAVYGLAEAGVVGMASSAYRGIGSLYGEAGRQTYRIGMDLLAEGKIGFGIVSAMISNGAIVLNNQQLNQVYQNAMTPSKYNSIPAWIQVLRNASPLRGYFQ